MVGRAMRSVLPLSLLAFFMASPAGAQINGYRSWGMLDRDVGEVREPDAVILPSSVDRFVLTDADGEPTDAVIFEAGLEMKALSRIRTIEVVPVDVALPTTPLGMPEGRGVCHLSFDLRPDGSVSDARIERCGSPLYADALVEAARLWRFQPVFHEGRAIPLRNIRQSFGYAVTARAVPDE